MRRGGLHEYREVVTDPAPGAWTGGKHVQADCAPHARGIRHGFFGQPRCRSIIFELYPPALLVLGHTPRISVDEVRRRLAAARE